MIPNSLCGINSGDLCVINKIDIKRIYAKNFLCFGPEGIEINFTKLDKIIVIKGENLDNKLVSDTSDEVTCSNGSGKSSIQEIISFGLFGKTIKGSFTGRDKLNLSAIINNKAQKNNKAVVEVNFGDYKVVRTRSYLRDKNNEDVGKSTLSLYRIDGVEEIDETQSTIAATSERIQNLLGLNFDSFVNLIVFTDNNSGSFLEADAAMKKSIIQDVLSLSVYDEYAKLAKESYNEVVRNRKTAASVYENLLKEKDNCIRRKAQVEQQETAWHATKKAEIAQLTSRVEQKKLELSNTDFGTALEKYNTAQIELTKLDTTVTSYENIRVQFNAEMKSVYEKQSLVRDAKNDSASKVSTYKNDMLMKKSEIDSKNKIISSLESQEENTVCSSCFSVIKKENFATTIKNAQDSLKSLTTEILEAREHYELENKLLADVMENLTKIDSTLKQGEDKLKELNLKIANAQKRMSELSRLSKPETGVQEKLIEEQINQLQKQLEDKILESVGSSPYLKIIEDATKDLQDKESECTLKSLEIQSLSEDEKYYHYWSLGFGDQGIRKLIISDIIPALNKKTAYWLQFLIDGKIKITFNNSLEETIERNPPDGDPFIYHAMSGGERRRLNLAVSQAFAHIMMLSCGYTPSIVFLDEVTTNIDPSGVIGVYNMILELSKEKQVIVTTHDYDLLNMLAGHGKIQLRKLNGITTLVNN